MAISSIHFASGHSGYFDHNSRESHTNNAIFSDEENYCSATKSEAFEVFKNELNLRTQAYTERTGQQLQKNMQTHISAIFNFNKDTTPEQAQAVCDYLEKVLDTKVVQLAMHRDEGHIIEDDNQDMHNAIKVDNAIKNYHGHIEMVGLDSQGYSIRKKLDKPMLREIQTEVAKLLNMERGRQTSYSKEEYQKITSELKPQNEYADKKEYNKAFSEKAKELGLAKERKSKRLDTYEYKEMAKQRGEAVKELQKELANAKTQIQEMKNDNTTLKKSNSTLKGSNTKLKNENLKLKEENKKLEDDIKKLNADLKAKMRENGAVRGDYAKLEQLNKDLKEDLKNKVLDHDKLLTSFKDLEEILIKKDGEIEDLKNKLELAEKRSSSYFGLNKELKEEITSLKEQISTLEIKEKEKEMNNVQEIKKELENEFGTNLEDLKKSDDYEKKSNFLDEFVKNYDESTKKTNLEKQNERKRDLLDKFQEVENKIENQVDTEPTKKRSLQR